MSLNLEPARYLAGWRRDACSLFLPAFTDCEVGEEVAVRIGIYGQSVRATVFGTVALVRRVGRPSLPPGVELALDAPSLAAAQFLALAARGEQVPFRERAPRWLHVERVVAIHGGAEREASTFNVSDGGCALSWPWAAPRVGEVVQLKLGTGFFASTAGALVCWSTTAGGPRVGLRLVLERRAARAWKSLAGNALRCSDRVS